MGLRRYRDRLEGIAEPTLVRLRGTVASANLLQSPVTAMRAALFRYGLGQRYMTSDRQQGESEVQQVFGYSVERGPLLLSFDGGHVLCEEGCRLRVEFEGNGFMSLPSFSGELPEALVPLLDQHSRGELIYAEQTLREGDPIELYGYVEPAYLPHLPIAGGTYREAKTLNGWRAVPAKGVRPRLMDRSLAELGY